jgi:hypothetical protein
MESLCLWRGYHDARNERRMTTLYREEELWIDVFPNLRSGKGNLAMNAACGQGAFIKYKEDFGHNKRKFEFSFLLKAD